MPHLLQYLAYGSNLHPGRLIRRTPSARLIGTTKLPGWTLHFNKHSRVDGSGKCHILPSGETADSVYAAVYELSPDDKPALDTIEGLGHGYREHTLVTDAFGEVFLYLAEADAIRRPIKPFEWYKQIVLAGARRHGFPDRYLDRINATAAMSDPDDARHREHMELLDTLGEHDACVT